METSNFVRVEKCTPEQLRKAFSKLPKAKLIDMLVECNRIIDSIRPSAFFDGGSVDYWGSDAQGLTGFTTKYN